MRETEVEVHKTFKKSRNRWLWERDRSLRSEKLKRNKITITETRKKLKREKTVSKSSYKSIAQSELLQLFLSLCWLMTLHAISDPYCQTLCLWLCPSTSHVAYRLVCLSVCIIYCMIGWVVSSLPQTIFLYSSPKHAILTVSVNNSPHLRVIFEIWNITVANQIPLFQTSSSTC